jgi:hypothetical protein
MSVYACIQVEYNDRAAADIIRWRIFQHAGRASECVFVMCARPTGDIPKYWVTLAHTIHARDVPVDRDQRGLVSGGRIRLTGTALINFSVSCAPWSRMKRNLKGESGLRNDRSKKDYTWWMSAFVLSRQENFDLVVLYSFQGCKRVFVFCSG